MVTITLKYLNNKSRKGLYYYVKEKGIRGQYFKENAKNRINEENLIEYYDKRYVQKKIKTPFRTYMKGLTKEDKPSKKKQLKGTEIKKLIGNERNTVSLSNVQNASKRKIQNATEKLISKSVKNPETRKRLAKYDQQRKYANKITHIATFKDESGKKLLIGKYFDKTTEEVIKAIQKRQVIGGKIEDGDNYNKTIQKLRLDNMRAIQVHNDGIINSYDLQIILRRG